jgi:8-amino-7-oxononanoate synthase
LCPPENVDFSSNDFLSLSTSPALRQLFLGELTSRPTFHLGSGGSRLLDGNSEYAESLERDISSFHNAPSGLLFNSGFDANSSIFSTLPQPGDIILYDELIHASVHEGMKLSRASLKLPFNHNSVDAFRRRLEALVDQDPFVRDGSRNVFVALESVYSMDGDLAPISDIASVIETYLPRRNGYIIVDEAHSNGVFGNKGRGLVCELGLEDKIFIRLHTFGKALAANGAIVLCSPLVREYLINYARPMIYTTFMSFPALAAIRAAYTFLQRNDGQDAQVLRNHLQDLCYSLHSQLTALDIGPKKLLRRLTPFAPRTPIFSLWTPYPRSLAAFCQEAGLVVRAIVAPTVPLGTERARICLHAGNTKEQVDALASRIREWVASKQTELDSVRTNSRL